MWKYGVIAFLLLTIAGAIFYKYNSLQNTIEKLNKEVADLTTENNLLTLEKELYIKDVNLLKSTIADQNKEIEKLAIQKVDLQKVYDTYKKKTTAEMFKQHKQLSELLADQNKSTCEYGEKLNKAISEINYKDL